ncbi:hypothetical protein ACF0H5_015924 [Mactra antiquata]
MSQEAFFTKLNFQYPDGSEELKNEIKSLKRKLDDTDFSDIDEQEYCNFANSIEEKMKRDVCWNNKLDYECKICDKKFNRKGNLKRHVITHSVTLECETCHKQFRRHDYLTQHQKLKHKKNIRTNYSCKHCHKKYNTYQQLFQHVTTNHPLTSMQKGGGKPLTQRTPNVDNLSNTVNDGITPGTSSMDNMQQEVLDSHHNNQQGALQNTIQDRTILPRNNEQYDMLTFFANTRNEITYYLIDSLCETSPSCFIGAAYTLFYFE